GTQDSRFHGGGATENGGLQLARQRPRTAQRGRARRRSRHGAAAGRDGHLAIVTGDQRLFAAEWRDGVSAAVAGGCRKGPHSEDADAHRLEQKPGRDHSQHRALNPRSQNQELWTQALIPRTKTRGEDGHASPLLTPPVPAILLSV